MQSSYMNNFHVTYANHVSFLEEESWVSVGWVWVGGIRLKVCLLWLLIQALRVIAIVPINLAKFFQVTGTQTKHT